jgi:hypothetical protein
MARLSVRAVHGEAAQKIAALTVALYALFAGVFLAQLVCGG